MPGNMLGYAKCTPRLCVFSLSYIKKLSVYLWLGIFVCAGIFQSLFVHRIC